MVHFHGFFLHGALGAFEGQIVLDTAAASCEASVMSVEFLEEGLGLKIAETALELLKEKVEKIDHF